MSSRRLCRIKGLAPETIKKLTQKKFITAKDLFCKNEFELIDELDISQAEVIAILNTVTNSIVQPAVTMWQLLCDQKSAQTTELSLMPAVDELRLIKGAITELVGPAGMGKTQACMMMCVYTGLPLRLGGLGGGVVYIDTEGTFAASRVLDMANQYCPGM